MKNPIRALLVLACLCAATFGLHAGQGDEPEFKTHWKVTAAEGMDAILLIGAASGDVMQSHIYADEIAYVRERFSDHGLAALDRLDVAIRQERGLLTGPSLAYLFSANSVESIEEVIASAEEPVTRLKPGLQTSPHWDPEQFEFALKLMPEIHTALTALRDIGFSDWYAQTQGQQVESAVESNLAAVSPYDIIPEQERLLGRPLDPTVEIMVVAFAQPYGIRILGQRFVAWYGWDGETQLRIAAHEIFHPPFDLNDEERKALLADLAADPWMVSIVEDHDPKYGYNSFDGVVNEDSTQALDQIVSERLGFAHDPAKRWQHSDGGMHMLAAALYHAMNEDGFAHSGGVYSDWLKSALRRGLLTPESVRRRAAQVVGQEVVDAWGPGRSGREGH